MNRTLPDTPRRVPPIRSYRQVQDRSLDWLRDETGLSKGNLSTIERGLSNPTPATLRKIGVALNIPEVVRFVDLWWPEAGSRD
jgi:transcriptional regulator with XRE-family HTH domain